MYACFSQVYERIACEGEVRIFIDERSAFETQHSSINGAYMKQGNARTKHPVLATFIVALLVAAAVAALGVFILKTMEDTREANAAQLRDEQVIQLADRISAKSTGETGGGDLAITSALTDLSSSDGRFWMLTDNGLILFVKNAKDTEAYRGKPASDYAESPSLTKALSSAREGKTEHAEATVQNTQFNTDTTKLTFNGRPYQLTLFTEATAAQDGLILGLPPTAAIACLGILAIIIIAPTLIAIIVSRSRRRPAPVRRPTGYPVGMQPIEGVQYAPIRNESTAAPQRTPGNRPEEQLERPAETVGEPTSAQNEAVQDAEHTDEDE